MRVPVGSTQITKQHRDAVQAVLKTNQISPGPVCRKFEEAFAERHGAKHGLFVNSGTDALRIAVLALKEKYQWPNGSGVIVPASTFVASANVVRQAGLSPVLADVSMYDSLINPDNVDRILSTMPSAESVKAIMPVHLFGNVCDAGPIKALAKKYRLKIIEDSCESAGVAKIYGDVACYSTYACHVMSTGVGGIALTNDKDLKQLMWSLSNHGRREPKKFNFVRDGYSARPTEMQAALGLVELENLDENLSRRKEIAWRLTLGLKRADVKLVLPEDSLAHAWMMYPLVAYSPAEKSALCVKLEKAGIETRDWVSLVGAVDYDTTNAQVSQDFKACGFYLGCHPGMSNKDCDYVVDTIRNMVS